MFDPRVVRGVTTGKPVQVLARVQVEPPKGKEVKEQRAMERTYLERTKQIRPQLKSVAELHANIVVPKRRTPVNLMQFLVEKEQPKFSSTQTTQTDEMEPRPPTPPYLPRKVGVDAEAQVDNAEVFEFDEDVKPLLELLISSTLDQAVMEVREDETLKNIAAAKGALEAKQEALEAKMAARVEAERDLSYKKERVLLDAQITMEKEAAVRDMLASHAVAKQFLARIQEDAFDSLAEHKYLGDPVADAVNVSFMPWLQQRVASNLMRIRSSAQIIDGVLMEAIQSYSSSARAEVRQRQREEEEQRRVEEERALMELEEKRKSMQIKLFIHTEYFAEPVGPIMLVANATVAEVEAQVIGLLTHRLGPENVPDKNRISFGWEGKSLDKGERLYKLGVTSLTELQMNASPLPRHGQGGGETGRDEEGHYDDEDGAIDAPEYDAGSIPAGGGEYQDAE